MLLDLASAVFLGSESLGTRDRILLSQTGDFPFRRLLWHLMVSDKRTGLNRYVCRPKTRHLSTRLRFQSQRICYHGDVFSFRGNTLVLIAVCCSENVLSMFERKPLPRSGRLLNHQLLHSSVNVLIGSLSQYIDACITASITSHLLGRSATVLKLRYGKK
jgi:hypothetical protein